MDDDANKVKVEMLSVLELFEPIGAGSGEVGAPAGAGGYQRVPYEVGGRGGFYSHYPVIVDPDGSPWGLGNRYIFSRITGAMPQHYRTMQSIAGDLARFRQWVLSEQIDFLDVPSRPRARPTYRYCTLLHDEIDAGRMHASTARRRMGSVQGFYRWLEGDGYRFEYPLWIENEAGMLFRDGRGFQRTKVVKSTDLTLSFKSTKSTCDYGEHIDDGGRLRPLPRAEQEALVDSLRSVNNIEMLLAFLLALTTGARLQTVFTFRVKHFKSNIREGIVAQRVKVGHGTLIDTKFGRQMVLLIPTWLYSRIQLYLRSPRYLDRVSRSEHVYPDEDERYAFLTRSGRPYYMASSDPFSILYRDPPRGNAVTQFIRQQLAPDLLRRGHSFDFHFHDLRATFGMNLLEEKLVNYKRGGVAVQNQPEFFQILMYVRERMGHSQLSTTEAYLNYRQKYHLAVNMQSDYEKYLESLVGK